MTTPTTLFLDQVYTLDGVTLTGEQIKNAIVENAIYRKHFSGDEEWATLQDSNHQPLQN